MCVDTNQDGKIDFMEFTERFHNPAKDIGFNMAVLLTNLSEHMPHDTRLQRLMDKAKSFLSYFQEYLGRIEIKGGAGYIERVYFEITESNIEQWNKPHIKVGSARHPHLLSLKFRNRKKRFFIWWSMKRTTKRNWNSSSISVKILSSRSVLNECTNWRHVRSLDATRRGLEWRRR